MQAQITVTKQLKKLRNKKRLGLAMLVLVPMILSACTRNPTRADGLKFKLIQESSIAPQNGVAFSICLFDGWDGYIGVSRQTRRPDSYRVDLIGGSGTIMIASADIFDNGQVQLLLNREIEGSSVVDYAKYIDMFKSCLIQHKKPVPLNNPER